MQTFLRYCVGLDISKDSLQIFLSVIESTGRVTVKATTKVVNILKGFTTLIDMVTRHRKLDLPLTYLMDSTGVYHEAVPWYLHQQYQPVSILLPNKAKYYLKCLDYKSKNDKINTQCLYRMGLEQQLPLWKPLSKNLYSLRLLTYQHQRLQELKTQSTNQQYALWHSEVVHFRRTVYFAGLLIRFGCKFVQIFQDFHSPKPSVGGYDCNILQYSQTVLSERPPNYQSCLFLTFHV